MKAARVLLADDHAILRAGLRLVLEKHSDLVVCGEASDGREAVDWVARHGAEIVVMDVGMPGLNGIEATAEILRHHPSCKVVMLSMHSDETYVLRCLRAGAHAYVLKESAESELIEAIRCVRLGRPYFSSKVSRLLREERVEDSFDRLGLREREVLQLIAEGHTNKEIAARLFLSVLTVETHRKNILQKLQLRGTPELVLYAVRKGLLTPGF